MSAPNLDPKTHNQAFCMHRIFIWSSQHPYVSETLLIPILERRNRRPRQGKQVAQDHTARKIIEQNWKSGGLAPKPMSSTIIPTVVNDILLQ